MEKYFSLEAGKHLEKSRVVVCVTHGVPAHNPFLHLFEADKDVVYLDNSAVTIVEKTLLSYHVPVLAHTTQKNVVPLEDEGQQVSNMGYEFTGLTPLVQSAPERLEKNQWNWEVR
jgi:hypothetical protein